MHFQKKYLINFYWRYVVIFFASPFIRDMSLLVHMSDGDGVPAQLTACSSCGRVYLLEYTVYIVGFRTDVRTLELARSKTLQFV